MLPGAANLHDDLVAISCASDSLCVAVDANRGRVLSSARPAGGLRAWKAVTIDPESLGASLVGVSCPSRTFCLAADQYGDVFRSSRPTGGRHAWRATDLSGLLPAYQGLESVAAVSCSSSSMCVVDGAAGEVISSRHPGRGRRAWGVVSIGETMTSVCVAVDDAGNLVTSTTPWNRRRAWRVTRLDPPYSDPPASYTYPLLDVSCPSLSLCVAIDGAGDMFASKYPAGGAAEWKRTTLSGDRGSPDFADAYGVVSCVSRALCVAVGTGAAEVSTDPTARSPHWATRDIDPDGGSTDGSNPMTDVSCPTVALCVAVDSDFNVLTSTTPALASPPWIFSYLYYGEGNATYVSCPSVTLCVAVDNVVELFTTTTPASPPTEPQDGATNWNLTTGATPNDPTAITCRSTSLCVVVGDGALTTSTNPTGGAQAWTYTRVHDPHPLTDVSCGSTSRCIAVDDAGNILLGTRRASSAH